MESDRVIDSNSVVRYIHLIDFVVRQALYCMGSRCGVSMAFEIGDKLKIRDRDMSDEEYIRLPY